MDAIKHYLTYAVLIAIFWTAVIMVPKCSRVTVPENYDDVDGLEPYSSFNLDTSMTLATLRHDDPVCFRLGTSSEARINFGWIAGLPGDEVAIVGGVIQVNGAPTKRSSRTTFPATAALTVPANHFYVISDNHQHDSVVEGPLPAIALRGRLDHL